MPFFNQITIVIMITIVLVILYPNNCIHHHGIHENNNEGLWSNPILSPGQFIQIL